MSSKGQLIPKANCQAEDSSKKQTNEFVFTSMRRVFVRFLEESSARKKTFRDYLTFSWCGLGLNAQLKILVVTGLQPPSLHTAKAMKSSPPLGPFCGSEFWGFSLLKI
jgi:hypothetical protein